MALRTNCVEYAFTTLLANLATDTTLAAAARHNTNVVDLHIPEVVNRTFKSVRVEVAWRDAFTVAQTVGSWRIGVKLGAAGSSDTDFAHAISHTGDHDSTVFTLDATAYFVANFGAGSSQTCQLAFAMATTAAAAINNITFKVIITYHYDDVTAVPAAITDTVRTLRIPLQSESQLTTTAQLEIGTLDGTNNAAPCNQIPKLDDWLPPGALIRNAWIEVIGNDGTQGTTDVQLFYQIDALTEVARATIEHGLDSASWFRDIITYDTATHSTALSHAFKLRASVASYFIAMGATLHVTYTFNPTHPDLAAKGIVNSLVFALKGIAESGQQYLTSQGTDKGDLFHNEIEINEPNIDGVIELMQSAIVFHPIGSTGGIFNCTGKGQQNRGYILNWSTVTGGTFPIHHRIDHGDGWIITKNFASTNWDSGACSAESIAGDGFLEFQVESTAVLRMCGLSADDPDFSYASIDYGIFLSAGPTIEVYENGVNKIAGIPYKISDVIRINRSGGKITYLKNGVLFYTSLTTSVAPLKVDTSIFTNGGSVSRIRLYSSSLALLGGWTLARSSVADAWVGAGSAETFAGDGYVQFTVSQTTGLAMIGLSATNPDGNFASIAYAAYLSAGTLRVVEFDSVYFVAGTYAIGDVIRVRRTGTTVTYEKNGVVVYTSLTPTAAPLLIDVSLFSANLVATAVRLFDNGAEVAVTWTGISSAIALSQTGRGLPIALSWPTSFQVVIADFPGLQLARGKNAITAYVFMTAFASMSLMGGHVILNYRSGIHGNTHTHNRSSHWNITDPTAPAANVNHFTPARLPDIPEANYRLTAHALHQDLRVGGGASTVQLSAEILAGEFNGDGWVAKNTMWFWASELGHSDIWGDYTDAFNRDPNFTGKLRLEVSRLWRRFWGSFVCDSLAQWITYRSITYTINGTIANFTGDGSGIPVDIFNALDEWATTTTTAVGGSFTATVYDSSMTHYAVARQDANRRGRSDDFIPGTTHPSILFDPDVTPPTITILEPPVGSALGGSSRIKFSITDVGGFRRQLPMFKFPTAEDPTKFRYELVHDGDNFTPDYEGTRTAIANGFEFEVSRRGGWGSTITYPGGAPTLVPFAYDTGGNESP